jgi:hypothetical protein
MVKNVAKQKVQELLYKTFHGIEPDPEPEAAADPEPEAAAPSRSESASPSSFPKGSLEHRLALVKTLYERGLIGEDDYRTKKAGLLSSL